MLLLCHSVILLGVIIISIVIFNVIILSVVLKSGLKIGVTMLFNKNPQKFNIQSYSSGAILNSFGAMAFRLLVILSNNKNPS